MHIDENETIVFLWNLLGGNYNPDRCREALAQTHWNIEDAIDLILTSVFNDDESIESDDTLPLPSENTEIIYDYENYHEYEEKTEEKFDYDDLVEYDAIRY